MQIYSVHVKNTHDQCWEQALRTDSLWAAKEFIVVGMEHGFYSAGTIFDRSTGAMLEINRIIEDEPAIMISEFPTTQAF